MSVKVFDESYVERLSSPLLSFGIFATALGFGVAMSLVVDDWGWLSRSGALATVGGFFATLRPDRAGFEEGHYTTTVYNEADDPVWIDHNEEEEWRNVVREQRNKRTRRNGISMIVFATVVWGFGDLIGTLIDKST